MKQALQAWYLLCAMLMSNDGKAAGNDDWSAWPVVGRATLTWMWFDVYDSTLRTPSGEYQAGATPLALQITYQRKISAEELLSATAEQWRQLGYGANDISRWLTALGHIFPNVSQGQQLVYVSSGHGGFFYWSASFSSDFKPIGQITDMALDNAFVAIWLSPNSAYPKLRQQLIGAFYAD